MALVDETELLERIDQDFDFLGETVDMLIADAPAALSQIRAAIDAGDAAAVSRGAHTLKGMIANFCAPLPHATAFELERMGREASLGGASTTLAALEEQVRTLIAELQALVSRDR